MTDATLAPEPILVSIDDAVQMLAIGRTALYELFKTGDVQAVKRARRTLVKVQSMKDFAARLPDIAPTLAS